MTTEGPWAAAAAVVAVAVGAKAPVVLAEVVAVAVVMASADAAVVREMRVVAKVAGMAMATPGQACRRLVKKGSTSG